MEDGEVLQGSPNSFHAVTMRFGLMFVPDPVAFLKGGTDAPSVAERFNPNTLPKR